MRFFLSLYISLFPFVVFCRDANTIDMVVSFLIDGNDERPTTLLIPELCWNSYQKRYLARTLSDHFMSIASSFQLKRTEHLLQHIVFLADLSCPDVESLLTKANEGKYFKSPYRWLLIDSEDNRSMMDKLDILVDSDVVFARRVSPQMYYFIEEQAKSGTLPITRSSPPWLCEEQCTKSTDRIRSSSIDSVITEFIFLHNIVYKIDEKTEVIEITRGAWKSSSSNNYHQENTQQTINESQFLYETNEMVQYELRPKMLKFSKNGVLEDYRESKVVSSRRHNLRRHVLTMSNVITDSNETIKHLDDRLNLYQDSIAKMSYAVVKVCFEMLNATERLLFTNTWGYRDQNGNWQGQINLLINREADLGTLTIFTQDRMRQVDYIAMVGSTAVRFVFREPPLAYVANIFTLPFTGAVWLAILICVLGCSVFLYIASKWEASMNMHPLQLDGSWADVLILIIGAVLQQGCTLEPRYAAGRVVTLLLFVALTILYAAYSANIVVLLRAPSASVRSLPDLLNSPLQFGASDFEYNRYFFKKLNDPIRKAIYDKKIAPKGKTPYFYTMQDGVEKIRQGLFAFHMELNPGYRLIQDTYMEHEKCDLVEIDYINEIDPWVPGQKRGSFRDLFKINFIRIRESGIQSAIHRRLNVPKPRCSGTISTFSSVGVTDIYPALLMTLYGFLVAPVTLILEITYHRLMLIRQKRKIRYTYTE